METTTQTTARPSFVYLRAVKVAIVAMNDNAEKASASTEWAPITNDQLDRSTAIKLIRDALRIRSGKAWSVKGGRGTAYGWITISAPPARMEGYYMSAADAAELGQLLGRDRPCHMQGESIAASSDYRRAYIERARGLDVTTSPTQYWD